MSYALNCGKYRKIVMQLNESLRLAKSWYKIYKFQLNNHILNINQKSSPI
jgi:hypothetical protein